MRCDEWCGYPPEYCDCKKEDVKVSELKMDSVIGAPCKHGSTPPFCDKCEITQLRQQLAEAEKPDWVKAGDNTLHGAIDHWQDRALRAEAKIAELNAKPEAGEAVACAKFEDGKVSMLAKLPIMNADWKPLYTHPAPVVPMVPYLKNRADAVDGHYCIARLTHDGYSEFWNAEASKWCSAGSVFNLGKAMLSATQEQGR